MDIVSTIYRSIKALPSQNIYELLSHYNIEVHYEPLLIPYGRESMILSSDTGHTVIFLRPISDKNYAEFLLWHELAHYVLHYKPNMKMNYFLSTRWMEVEMQANLFATIGLLLNENMSGSDPVQIAISKGIPSPIAEDTVRRILAWVNRMGMD